MSVADQPALPRLHVVTDDRVLADERWTDRAISVMERCGPALALHVRGPGSSGAWVFSRTVAVRDTAARTGALLAVNDRVDVALAAGVRAVQLGTRSLPVEEARALLGDGALVGASVHGIDAVRAAAAGGADFAVLGTVFPTPSHPGLPGIGVSGLRDAVGACGRLRVVAIGGIGVEHVGDVVGTGAHGVAVLRGVWDRRDPATAAAAYLSAIEEAMR